MPTQGNCWLTSLLLFLSATAHTPLFCLEGSSGLSFLCLEQHQILVYVHVLLLESQPAQSTSQAYQVKVDPSTLINYDAFFFNC